VLSNPNIRDRGRKKRTGKVIRKSAFAEHPKRDSIYLVG
jgi:hypothetical protein